jgi:hypothetical protein
MSLEFSEIGDRECGVTRTEMWRIALFAVGGVLFLMGIGAAELLPRG